MMRARRYERYGERAATMRGEMRDIDVTPCAARRCYYKEMA